MYGGRIVEQGTLDELFYDPQHPYTWGLLGSIARVDRAAPRRACRRSRACRRRCSHPPQGCHFRPRCPHAFEQLHARCRRSRRACGGAGPPRPLLADAPTRSATGAQVDGRIGLARRGGGDVDERAAGDERRPLLEVEHLAGATSRSGAALLFDRTVGHVHAVDDVSLDARARARRSGSSASRAAARRRCPRAHAAASTPTGGTIRFRGAGHHARAAGAQLRPMRREMQMVFQDPQASLNPRKRVGQIVGAPLRLRGPARSRASTTARASCSSASGCNPEHVNRFPHEFSGGQRQRIGIARALAVEPTADRARRAGLGARRLDPGAGRQPARRPAGRVRPHLRVRRPRPVRRAPRLRPDRGHVPRQDHGALAGRGALRQADPPVHVGAARRDPDPGPAREPRARARSSSAASRRTRSTRRSGCRFHTRCPRATEICAQVEPPLTEYAERPPGRLPPPAQRHRTRRSPRRRARPASPRTRARNCRRPINWCVRRLRGATLEAAARV